MLPKFRSAANDALCRQQTSFSAIAHWLKLLNAFRISLHLPLVNRRRRKRPISSSKARSMYHHKSLISELEDAVRRGSQEKRVETLRRITGLFLGVNEQLDEEQILVFDQVCGHLITRMELTALVELSERLAHDPSTLRQSRPKMVTPVSNPPGQLKLLTRPSLTGSPPLKKTIGVLVVARSAAIAEALSAAITQIHVLTMEIRGKHFEPLRLHPLSIDTRLRTGGPALSWRRPERAARRHAKRQRVVPIDCRDIRQYRHWQPSRTRRERPRRHSATDKVDELAPQHVRPQGSKVLHLSSSTECFNIGVKPAARSIASRVVNERERTGYWSLADVPLRSKRIDARSS